MHVEVYAAVFVSVCVSGHVFFSYARQVAQILYSFSWSMVHYEQAALLATAWANDPHVSSMAARHGIVVPPAKMSKAKSKITRGHCVLCSTTCVICESCAYLVSETWGDFRSYLSSGDLKTNAEAIGLACKHVGMRPSIAIMEQAAHAFFSMKLPRDINICSIMTANIWMYFQYSFALYIQPLISIYIYICMHVWFVFPPKVSEPKRTPR